MNELEERLADELGDVATRLEPPYVDTAGLVRAGRRERRRPRVLTGAVALAAAVAVVAGFAASRPGHGSDRGPEVANDPVGLGRPLELPWWGWDGVSEDLTQGVLHLGSREIAADGVRALVHAEGTTLADGDQGWMLLEGDAWRPLGFELVGAPVAGAGGALAYVTPGAARIYGVASEIDGEFASQPVTGDEPPVVVGFAGDSLLLTTAGRLFVWPRGATRLSAVTGVPDGEVRPRPGGLAVVGSDGTMATGTVVGTRFRRGWTAPVEGDGVWSDDGSTYAEASDGEVRLTTSAGTAGVPLGADRLRVVGWESRTEVVVAQWIEADGAVTGWWRCSISSLECAAIDGPNGRAVLPGLSPPPSP